MKMNDDLLSVGHAVLEVYISQLGTIENRTFESENLKVK